MSKKFIRAMSVALAIGMLAGCGTLTDNTNYNFSKDNVAVLDENGEEVAKTVITNRNKTAEVYFDTTVGMQDVVKDEIAQGIVQDASDAIIKTWNDVDISLYTIGESAIEEQSGISYINNISAINYAGSGQNALMQAVEHQPNKSGDKIITPRIKLIVTDLSTQLNDYQWLAGQLSENLMHNEVSFAIISVKTSKPMFIFAIGSLQDLSDYIDQFYQMPNVLNFNGQMDFMSIDEEHNINCKMFMQNSGIIGINYDGVSPVEQGRITSGDLMPPPNGQGMSGSPGAPNGGAPGAPNGGVPGAPNGGAPGAPNGGAPGAPNAGGPGDGRTDESGSFTKLRTDYTITDAKSIVEGTVNFMPENDGFVKVVIPENISEDDVTEENIRYLSFKSLLWDRSETANETTDAIAGKIKFTVPFRVAPQIQLTDLTFESNTNYYDANKGDSEFYDADKHVKNNIEASYAYNDGPTSATWRIDNIDKTAMVNIYISDLLDLSYATKLDINFSVYDPGKIPAWVETWTTKEDYYNLKSFISLLNDYAASDNKYEETLTVYVLAGDKESDEIAEVEALSDSSESKPSQDSDAANN